MPLFYEEHLGSIVDVFLTHKEISLDKNRKFQCNFREKYLTKNEIEEILSLLENELGDCGFINRVKAAIILESKMTMLIS